MQQVFWLIEGVLAGRSGPNKDAWDPRALRASGIGAVLSVNGGEGCDPKALAEAGLDYACFPFSTNVPPLPGDDALCAEQAEKALAWLLEHEARGVPVLVHCRNGRDRTGILMACYLMHKGAAPVHAVSQVRSIRETAFSSEGWDQLVYDVLYRMQN
ncbi:dual specificity protein phosphatase family protein [Shewanella cyperi]|uniref:Dual specificity protein phosphatase family protein n=2 Tax=Shewanella TaxID=22 RepID=A0A974XKU8_9GAMM|nr:MULTISPECIES: dual specificity protein phosphatase family protein [Shewanella]QSX28871.1 dual specificity protein phosphatase family protein [Shewanella cyperi]QSX35987.1 dual specificity protein phosphatase family protein [Shewanella sedimentimangrovi]